MLFSLFYHIYDMGSRLVFESIGYGCAISLYHHITFELLIIDEFNIILISSV
jgi:hypothetical protein